ncbi:hypothetical protein INR49_000443 [Caranx melampygus]|nr:hypothetical protein INR49_000443 [Caranx melampygus]
MDSLSEALLYQSGGLLFFRSITRCWCDVFAREKAEIIRTESNRHQLWIMEIRKWAHKTVNWDKGA